MEEDERVVESMVEWKMICPGTAKGKRMIKNLKVIFVVSAFVDNSDQYGGDFFFLATDEIVPQSRPGLTRVGGVGVGGCV